MEFRQNLLLQEHTASTSQCISTYEQIANRVQEVKDLLNDRGIRIRSGSSLDQLFRQAQTLDQQWRTDSLPNLKMLCNAAQPIDWLKP